MTLSSFDVMNKNQQYGCVKRKRVQRMGMFGGGASVALVGGSTQGELA